MKKGRATKAKETYTKIRRKKTPLFGSYLSIINTEEEKREHQRQDVKRE